MHIAEGVLSNSTGGMLVLGAGFLVTAAGTAIGLRRIDYQRMPQVATLSAAFFVASLVHVPLGVTSVHLVLNGVVGLLLGWAAFPAILIALILQAVFFQFGGITTLGINTAIMAVPAVACHLVFSRACRRESLRLASVAAAAAGAGAIAMGALLVAAALLAAGESFAPLVAALLPASLPLAAVEALVTTGVVDFLRKVRPEMLSPPVWLPDQA